MTEGTKTYSRLPKAQREVETLPVGMMGCSGDSSQSEEEEKQKKKEELRGTGEAIPTSY